MLHNINHMRLTHCENLARLYNGDIVCRLHVQCIYRFCPGHLIGNQVQRIVCRHHVIYICRFCQRHLLGNQVQHIVCRLHVQHICRFCLGHSLCIQVQCMSLSFLFDIIHISHYISIFNINKLKCIKNVAPRPERPNLPTFFTILNSSNERN